MALRRRPKSESMNSAATERQIEALIDKGGSVTPSHKGEQETKPQLVQFIDRTRKRRLVAPSRHAWLLEAFLERLVTYRRKL